jgi:hypothetical protein
MFHIFCYIQEVWDCLLIFCAGFVRAFKRDKIITVPMPLFYILSFRLWEPPDNLIQWKLPPALRLFFQ